MIPSDHFVRFYNEVFKFLDEKHDLEAYYQRVSSHQELHCLKDFQEKGLQGVYDYMQKICKEENCDMDVTLNDGELISMMNKCPSLSKAIDNDAGVCLKYCLHCPGWTAPLYLKSGIYQIYDIMGIENPQCCEWLYTDLARARKKYKELLPLRPAGDLVINFDPE